MIVDAHQHFWTLDAPWFDWPAPALERVYREYAPADLAPLIRAAGLTPVVEPTASYCDWFERIRSFVARLSEGATGDHRRGRVPILSFVSSP